MFGFRSYGQDDGLSNLAVYGIAQGADGFLWVGTDDGVYRYDGHAFKGFSRGLPSRTIWNLAVSSDNVVWVSTTKGLFKLEQGLFRAVEGVPPRNANGLCLGSGGRALVFVDQELYGGDSRAPLQRLRNFPERIRAVWASADLNSVLALTDTALWHGLDGQWRAEPLPALAQGRLGRILQDREGRIWLRGRFNLWRRDPAGAWVDLSARLPGGTTNLTPPVEDQLGRIWTGTSKGLLCLDGNDSWVLGEEKGLPGGWAGSVLVDREGSLWVGSEGVHRLKGRFLWTGFGVRQGLPAATVWDVGRGGDGRLYACTAEGIAVLAGDRWQPVPGTPRSVFSCKGLDGRGGLWFGGASEGQRENALFHLDCHTGQVERIQVPGCSPQDNLLAIADDGQGGVYAGSGYQGLFRIRPRPGGGWRVEPTPIPGLSHLGRVNSLVRDPAGRLWLAGEQGVQVLEDGVWHKVEGLKDLNCSGLALDPQGRVWLSYDDVRGISQLSARKGEWRVAAFMDQPQALFQERIASMGFDRAGVLWLGTSAGMKRWDGVRLEIYGRGEGLPSQDPSDNAMWVDADGEVWHGFSNGIGHYDPRARFGSPSAPEARLLEVATPHSLLPLTDTGLRLRYRDHTLTFHFSALTFLDEARVIHEVRLLGLENEWRETRIAEARYPALESGSYTFEVRSRYPEGTFGVPASFSFRILPPWWDTWWFLGLATGSIAAAIYLGYRWRTRQLFQQNALLERMVATRTEALERACVDLEQQSLVDPLTGLYNRHYLEISLPKDILQARRVFQELLAAGEDPLQRKEDFLVFMFDIDHFKEVNDTWGHVAGDAVLRQFADALSQATRNTDSLIRWGGEEFLLIARRSRRTSARVIVDKFFTTMRSQSYLLPNGQRIQRTCSIGFTALPLHPQHPGFGTWEQMLDLADQCLYLAKNTGRDRWVGALATPGVELNRLARLWPQGLEEAVAAGDVELLSSRPAFNFPS
jgi:diguanylate cyclase (GGDEF)-like protein